VTDNQDNQSSALSEVTGVDGELAPVEEKSLTQRLATEVGIDTNQAERAIQMVRASYSGPIPPTSEIHHLNNIAPNLGTRIVEDHLEQRNHDRNCDLASIDLAKKDSVRRDGWLSYAKSGQNYGMLSLFIFVIAAFGALYLKQPWVAGAFLSAPVVGTIANFINGRKSSDDIKPDA
jgi:uncharacterized membrane protein